MLHRRIGFGLIGKKARFSALRGAHPTPVPATNQDATAASGPGGSTPDAAVDALIRQLIGANPLVGLSISGSMLHLIFEENVAPSSAALLTRHQKRALLALADHGPFKIANGHFANFGMLLHRYGLPSTREALVQWLET